MYKLDGLKETTGQKAVHAKKIAACKHGFLLFCQMGLVVYSHLCKI